MNLRQVEIFRAVMQNNTATRAAEVLRVSQPAVSKTIQELERAVGFKLFHRIKGRMVPTQEGQLLFREVEQVFSGLTYLRSSAARIRDFGSGELRIASLSAFSTNIMPTAIAAFQKKHPSVAITFQTRMSSEVRDLVASGQFDVGVAADEIDLTGVESKPFATHTAAIALPLGHALTSKKTISPRDLEGENFVALAPEDTTRREIDEILARENVTPKIVIETPYSTTICAMVRAGIGIGLVNPITAEPFLNQGLVLRPFSQKIHFRTLLLFPPNRVPSRILQDFLKELTKHSSAK